MSRMALLFVLMLVGAGAVVAVFGLVVGKVIASWAENLAEMVVRT